MKLATAIALLLISLLGVGAVLNTDLVLRRFPVDAGFAAVSVPVILCLVLFAAGSWILFLVAASTSQGYLLRKVEDLSIDLDEKERELLGVKAASFEETVETLRNITMRLDQRLHELEVMLAQRPGEPIRHPASLESRAA
ncbi:MAG TPA: hypothetical protein VEH53_01435 [archaeon]|nr:hypothetical protein [archaeon]